MNENITNDNKEECKVHNMGIGALGNPELVFVRQFRFLLSGDHLVKDYTASVDIDWMTKIISLKAYEVIFSNIEGVPIHNWADAMLQGEYPQETLTLITLDGCGNELYKYQFKNLKIIGRENSFDYANSDASYYKVTISFGSSKKIPVTSEKHKVTKKTLTEVNHLNAKTWVK